MILCSLCFAVLQEQAAYNRTYFISERLLQNSAAAVMFLLLLLRVQVVIYDLHKELNIFKLSDLPPPCSLCLPARRALKQDCELQWVWAS